MRSIIDWQLLSCVVFSMNLDFQCRVSFSCKHFLLLCKHQCQAFFFFFIYPTVKLECSLFLSNGWFWRYLLAAFNFRVKSMSAVWSTWDILWLTRQTEWWSKATFKNYLQYWSSFIEGGTYHIYISIFVMDFNFHRSLNFFQASPSEMVFMTVSL